ncbi:MAG: hypothetical protein ACNS62_02490 [Candidatus Cyclobacteriaceae bacterium M3_2C_046]
MVRKFTGLDVVVDHIVRHLGHLQYAYLGGDMVHGINTNIIDLILVGRIDENYLVQIIPKAEQMINRRIRYLIYHDQKDLNEYHQPVMLLWQKDE